MLVPIPVQHDHLALLGRMLINTSLPPNDLILATMVPRDIELLEYT